MSASEETMTTEKLEKLIEARYFERFIKFGDEFDFCWGFVER
ncbi:hypothetical protein GCM10009687_42030 [Asanoa iriomotensis]|uniref:Uncharacterized protein n=1 Tax=Asanoa iriomotensis TaxID=234613 RepID=A0ABQ4C3T8_9ACTN|nr:hypothetical protein Air01nite_35530 [Asanoa iriomotensis]